MRCVGRCGDRRRDGRCSSLPQHGHLRPFHRHAPVPVLSGSSRGKVRLNRGGNRTTNCALHKIAVTQARGNAPARQTSTGSSSEERAELPVFGCSAGASPMPSSQHSEPTRSP
ncbi:transposase [Microlunatus speluncae]|uniref:transposase n=1 Tax=Microlunatus speluncae TaxID=2594267 RepID=UPI001C2D4D4C